MEIEVKIKKTNGETELIKSGEEFKRKKDAKVHMILELNPEEDAELKELIEKAENIPGAVVEVRTKKSQHK